MALFKSANPALRANTFTKITRAKVGVDTMSIQGTVNKCAILILVLILAGIYSWTLYDPSKNSPAVAILLYGSSIGALVVGSFIAFSMRSAPYLAWLYAALEGLALGIISRAYHDKYPGIVVHSIALTVFVFASLLVIYTLRLIKVTKNIKLMIASATAAIAFFYMSVFLMRYFGIPFPFFDSSDTGSILLSIFIAGIAALNLVVDFDFVEQGASLGVPKYLEWYGAFGLMVTLVWLYLEILRLLAKGRKKW